MGPKRAMHIAEVQNAIMDLDGARIIDIMHYTKLPYGTVQDATQFLRQKGWVSHEQRGRELWFTNKE